MEKIQLLKVDHIGCPDVGKPKLRDMLVTTNDVADEPLVASVQYPLCGLATSIMLSFSSDNDSPMLGLTAYTKIKNIVKKIKRFHDDDGGEEDDDEGAAAADEEKIAIEKRLANLKKKHDKREFRKKLQQELIDLSTDPANDPNSVIRIGFISRQGRISIQCC
jgi:hypothetical protein